MQADDFSTIRSRFLPLLLQYMAVHGHDAAAFAGRNGLSATISRVDPVPRQLFEAVIETAERELAEPFLGVNMARAIPRGSYGVLEFAIRTAPDIRNALERITRYQRLVSDRVEFTVESRSDEVVLEQRISGLLSGATRQPNEFSVCVLVRILRELAGPSFVPSRVWVAHGRPPRIDELVAFLGTDRIEYGCDYNGIGFPIAYLDQAVVSADAALLPVLDDHAQQLLRDMPHVSDLVGTVREAIHNDLLNGTPDLERIARKLHMSARTLQRRLAERATAFKDLVEQVRGELAERHLQSEALSIGEVAYLLGYSDTRAFLRAFKRWTGTTPGEYRERHVS